MINGKTKTGFHFSVDENSMNDMELVDILADDSVDESFRISKLLKKLLPGDQRRALYDHVRVDDRVPVDSIITEVGDIFDAMGNPGKNS